MTDTAPNKYIVRVFPHDAGTAEDWKVFAFSAEDAKTQVDTQLRLSTPVRGHIVYVGPVNPSCTCLNKCYCGTQAR